MSHYFLEQFFLVMFLLAAFRFCKPSMAFTTRAPTRNPLVRRYFASTSTESNRVINLLTIPLEELQQVCESWGYPKYRADQVYNWIRQQGVTDIDEMTNLPKKLRESLREYATMGSLQQEVELVSKDGTKKRAYRLWDGQLIESVLMPYEDGRYTACISSQAGCAMGCVFCATGQMGFARQLTSEEIFEQVARFATELSHENKRLSNVVFMGMGEPLANYKNVLGAVDRINNDLRIGARRITVSTVGLVPNIRKLMEDLPQVRLAVSLHCASDEERTALLPANRRYGGLTELMTTLREYIETTGRRITLEWALIEGENDTPQTARQLGELIVSHNLRRDMVHVNVIPLNPTGGFAGSPSGRSRVNEFISILEKEYGISTTPRVRRGIDINAGCGQLKSEIEKKKQEEGKESLESFVSVPPTVGVYNAEDEDEEVQASSSKQELVEFTLDDAVVDMERDDYEDPEFESEVEQQEAARLIALVQNSFPAPPAAAKTTSITDDDSIQKAKRRRKKLLKNLNAIRKLKEFEENGRQLNAEQREKVAREAEWTAELESVQHNLQ